MATDAIVLHAMGGGLVLFGLLAIRAGYRQRRRADRVDETETTPIRRVEPGDGPVQVEGTARPTDDGTVPAHVDETEGMVVETVVQTWQRGDDPNSGGHWDRRRSHEECRPFLVEDDTGTAVVDVDGDGVDLELSRTKTTVERNQRPPKPVREHLDSVEYGGVDRQKTRYLQGAVEPDEDVYVYATAVESRPGWDGASVVLSSDPSGEETVISDRSESAVVESIGASGGKLYFVGAVLFVLGAWIGVLPLT